MRATTVAVSRRRLTVATAVQIGGRVVGAFLGVLVAATLARSLTRPEFGELSLALTILALAGSLSDLGIGQIAVREMARRPQDRARIAGALCVAQLTMGVVLGVIGIVIAFALMHGAQARVMAVFVMATMPLGALGALTIAAQARLRPELVIIPALVQNVLWLAVVVALGASNGALSLYGLGALVAAVVQSAVIVVLTVRITSVTFTGTRTLIVDLLRMAWPIGLAGMFVTAYYRIDALLLFHYRGATPNAYYSAAYRVLDVLQILPMTVSGVLLPLLASADREGAGHDRIRQLFQFAIALLLAVAVPVAICGAILAPGVVRLIYGPHYHSSVYLLQILLPAFIPICLGLCADGPADPARPAAPIRGDHVGRSRSQHRRQRARDPALWRSRGRLDDARHRAAGDGRDRRRRRPSPAPSPPGGASGALPRGRGRHRRGGLGGPLRAADRRPRRGRDRVPALPARLAGGHGG